MGALEILQAWLLKLCSQCQRGQQSSRWGDSTDSQGSLTWAPGQPELCVCSLVRLLEGAGQLPSAWWSKSKLLIIAYLSEVTHLNASCDNRSWCWWVSLPEDTIVAKSKKKKAKASGHQAGNSLAIEFWCFSVLEVTHTLAAIQAALHSADMIQKTETTLQISTFKRQRGVGQKGWS